MTPPKIALPSYPLYWRDSIFKYLLTLSTVAALLASLPVNAQDENVTAADAEKIVPLIKMTKPELRIIYKKDPYKTVEDEVVEDEVIARATKNSRDPIICKELAVRNIGLYSNNGSRIRRTETFCSRKSKWNERQANTQKVVQEMAGL